MTNPVFDLNAILAKATQQAPDTYVAPSAQANIQEKYQTAGLTGQQKFYIDLCKRLNEEPQDVTTLKGYELYNLIEELKSRPLPASPDQIRKIKEMVEEINQAGQIIKPFSDEFLARLTGGREGSASSLIETLFAKRKEITDSLPPSDAQSNILVDWMFCPDIPFEQYQVNKKVMIEDESVKIVINNAEVLPYRFMTRDEFKTEIQAKMKRREASAFIDQYRDVYYTWNKTRITKFQAEQIRKLEMRLANIETPKAVEFAIDDEGNVIEMNNHSSREAYNPVAYDMMSEEALRQLSSQQASLVIDMMKAELKDRSLTKFPETNDQSQLELESKRQAKSIQDARIREFTRLDDIIYKLEARVGHEDMELHASIKENILDGDNAVAYKILQDVKEFMMQTIDFKNTTTIAKSIGALFTMVDGCMIAERLVEDIQSELKSK